MMAADVGGSCVEADDGGGGDDGDDNGDYNEDDCDLVQYSCWFTVYNGARRRMDWTDYLLKKLFEVPRPKSSIYGA